jgi:hypothetical protein
MDDFGCKQLDKIEQNVAPAISKTVNTYKEAGITGLVGGATELVGDALVPVDNYLKQHTVVAFPINVAVGAGERVADFILPEQKTKEEKQEVVDDSAAVGPSSFLHSTNSNSLQVHRAGKLSKSVQRRAFQKFKDLTPRNPENLHYVVDLIKYAAENLDASLKAKTQVIPSQNFVFTLDNRWLEHL